MRKLLLLLSLTLCVVCCAQQHYSTNSKKAIELFEQARITDSANKREALLRDAIRKDKRFVEAYWLLAQHVARHGDIDAAVQVLTPIDNDTYPRFDETSMLIAEWQFSNGEYASALRRAELITDGAFASKRLELIERYQAALTLYENPVPFAPISMDAINTRFDNYFPSITADGLMISTTVEVNEPPAFPHEELFWSYYNNGHWLITRPLGAPINTPDNEGSQSFSADGRYMFFVGCNRKNGHGGCDIYYAMRIGNTWSAPILIDAPVNTEYWESNPVLSPSGDELFFVSNRQPSIGGKDIWHCHVTILDDGTLRFSDAENLGTPINTPKDDFAPFMHANNRTLYFASTGHLGLGGSDIFIAERTAEGWSTPRNIGYPINTHGDESSMVVNCAGTKAYFSSNTIDPTATNRRIYEIELPEEARPTPMSYVVGRTYNAANKSNIDATVEIFEASTSNRIYESIADRLLGTFTGYLPPQGEVSIYARKYGFLPYSATISATADTILIPMQPIRKGSFFTLNNLYFDSNSAAIQPASRKEIGYLVQFLRQHSRVKIEISGHTDNTSTPDYNLQLSQQRADALRYILLKNGIAAERVTAVGRGQTEPIADNATEAGRARNRRVEVKITGE